MIDKAKTIKNRLKQAKDIHKVIENLKKDGFLCIYKKDIIAIFY